MPRKATPPRSVFSGVTSTKFSPIHRELSQLFKDAPPLDLGPRGDITGYIDFIEPEEMLGPLAKGVDRWGRPFFAVRFRVTYADTQEETCVIAYFQRYMQDTRKWIVGGKPTLEWFITEKRVPDLEHLRRLLVGPVGPMHVVDDEDKIPVGARGVVKTRRVLTRGTKACWRFEDPQIRLVLV